MPTIRRLVLAALAAEPGAPHIWKAILRELELSLIAGGYTAAVIGAACLVGRGISIASIQRLLWFSCVTGVILAWVGTVLIPPPKQQPGLRVVAAIGLVAYFIAAVRAEPFHVRPLEMILWLSPLVLMATELARSRLLLSAIGYWLVLFGMIATLVVNGFEPHGFFGFYRGEIS